MSNQPKSEARLELERRVRDTLDASSRQIAGFCGDMAAVGIAQSKVLIGRPEGLPKVGVAVIIMTAPMSEEDLRRLRDFSHGFLQDLVVGHSHKFTFNKDTLGAKEGQP